LAADAREDDPGPASFIKRAAEHLGELEVEIEWGDGSKQVRGLHTPPAVRGEPRVRYLSQQFVERLSQRNTRGDRDSYGLFDTDEALPRDELLEEIERVVFEAIGNEDRAQQERFADLRDLRLGAHLTDRETYRETIMRNTEFIASENEKRRNVEKFRAALAESTREKQAIEKDIKAIPTHASNEHVKKFEDASARVKALQDTIAAEGARADALEQIIADLRRQTQAADAANAMLRARHPKVLEPADWEKLRLRPDDAAASLVDAKLRLSRARAQALRAHGSTETIEDGGQKAGLEVLLAAVDVAKKALGEDAERTKRRMELGRRLDIANRDEARWSGVLADAEKASERISAAQTARLDAYENIFKTIDEEVSTLRTLYEPLEKRLATDTDLSLLHFEVVRHVDIDAWVSGAEQTLFDGRKLRLPDGKSLREAVEPLHAVWRTGTPSAIRLAHATFLSAHIDAFIKALRAGVSPLDLGRWAFATDHISVRYGIQSEGRNITNLSPGARGVVLLSLFLAIDQHDERPLVIDQPEENLDPRSIYTTLRKFFRSATRRRQIIMVTHNANLVVNTDSDQVIVAEAAPGEAGKLPQVTYVAGGLEDSDIWQHVCTYLEGGAEAFRKRGVRYGSALT
jgi:hypothetical protein